MVRDGFIKSPILPVLQRPSLGATHTSNRMVASQHFHKSLIVNVFQNHNLADTSERMGRNGAFPTQTCGASRLLRGDESAILSAQ
jgi:hypothetical protein